MLLPNYQVAQYREEAGGENVFVTAVCDSWFDVTPPELEDSEFFPLPRRQQDAMQKGVLAFVAEDRDFQKLQPLLSSRCNIRERHMMKKTLISIPTLLATLNEDQRVSFYPTLADATNARYGPEARVEFDAGAWPSAIIFLRGPQKGESYRLQGAGTQQLFRSDMDGAEGWWASPQKNVHALEIVASGLRAGERSGDFKTDKGSGYIVSEFKPTPGVRSGLYFFAWVKTIQGNDLPKMSLQNDKYEVIARAGVLTQRGDGWTLLGGWIPRTSASSVRLLIEQDRNMDSLIDKVTLSAVP